MGRMLILVGVVCLVAGILVTMGPKGVFGHLPGDLSWRVGHAKIFLPLGTSLLISVVISVVLWLFHLFHR